MSQRVSLVAWLTLSIMILAGCSKPDTSRQQTKLPLDQVPRVVMDAALKSAKEKYPDLTFQSAWKKSNGLYEIVGKGKKGKVREFRVTESGEVVAIE